MGRWERPGASRRVGLARFRAPSARAPKRTPCERERRANLGIVSRRRRRGPPQPNPEGWLRGLSPASRAESALMAPRRLLAGRLAALGLAIVAPLAIDGAHLTVHPRRGGDQAAAGATTPGHVRGPGCLRAPGLQPQDWGNQHGSYGRCPKCHIRIAMTRRGDRHREGPRSQPPRRRPPCRTTRSRRRLTGRAGSSAAPPHLESILLSMATEQKRSSGDAAQRITEMANLPPARCCRAWTGSRRP